MEALARRVAGERRVALLDLTREYRASRHELLAACERVLERMQLLGGEEVRAFESEMAAYLGVRQVCGVASGTDALALALQAAGLEPGDEVLVQANAFVAAVEGFVKARSIPMVEFRKGQPQRRSDGRASEARWAARGSRLGR